MDSSVSFCLVRQAGGHEHTGIGFTLFTADDKDCAWDGLGSPCCLISHRFRATTDSSPFPIGGGSESVGAMDRRCLGSDKGMRTEESRIAFPGLRLPKGYTRTPTVPWLSRAETNVPRLPPTLGSRHPHSLLSSDLGAKRAPKRHRGTDTNGTGLRRPSGKTSL